MKKQFAVIGMGKFGQSVAKQLYKLGHQVLAVDDHIETIDAIAEQVTHAVQANATDEASLRALGLSNFDAVIIAISTDLQAAVMAVMICRDLGVKHIIAKSVDELHARILMKVGADKVILPERDSGIRLANSLVEANTLDFIELSESYNIVELSVPEKWQSKTIAQVDVRGNYGITIIAAKSFGEVVISPPSTYILKPGDVLVVISTKEALAQIESNRD